MTQDQVVALLGEPDEIRGSRTEGGEVWLYSNNLPGLEYALLYFDDRGGFSWGDVDD